MKLFIFGIAILMFSCFPLVAFSASQDAILTWNDLSNEDSYVIERKVGPAVYAQVGTTLKDVLTFTDSGLLQGTTYCYRVFGKNTLGSGVPSDEVCVNTAGIPGKVGGLNVIIQITP